MQLFFHEKSFSWYKKLTYIGAPILIIYIIFLHVYIDSKVDIYPVRYSATLADGIDFSKDGYPFFIEKVTGLSVRENWGRWSNQYRGEIKINFKNSLPENFILKINAIAFNINGDSPTDIRIGNQSRQILIANDKFADYSLEFSGIRDINAIEITPPHPIAPAQIDGVNKDGRLLGIGLHSIRIISDENK